MLRLGIVGSDNSHAIAYSRLANVERHVGDAARVVAITGRDAARTAEVAQAGQIPAIVETPENLISQVDGVLVVDRHGDLHADHALPFLRRGIPVYVDKPFAISLDDCRTMIATARRAGAILTSFSSLRVTPTLDDLAAALPALGAIRSAQFAGRCDFDSEYGGPFFYATHTAEIAFRLLGDDVATVRAIRAPDATDVIVTWSNGMTGTISYYRDAASHFHAALFGTGGFVARELVAGDPSYGATLLAIIRTFQSGASALTPRQMLAPIVFVHAIQRAIASDGAPVEVGPVIEDQLAALDRELAAPAEMGS